MMKDLPKFSPGDLVRIITIYSFFDCEPKDLFLFVKHMRKASYEEIDTDSFGTIREGKIDIRIIPKPQAFESDAGIVFNLRTKKTLGILFSNLEKIS